MNLKQIKKHLERAPFQPFELESYGGTHIAVNRAADIHISDYDPYIIVVFDGDGTFTAIESDDVASLHST
jgi:hypothetical protein